MKILTRRPEREGGRYGFQRYALPTNENRARHGDGTAIAKPAMSEVRPRRSRRGGGTNRQLEPVVRLRSLRDALHRAAIAHYQTSVGPRPAAQLSPKRTISCDRLGMKDVRSSPAS